MPLRALPRGQILLYTIAIRFCRGNAVHSEDV